MRIVCTNRLTALLATDFIFLATFGPGLSGYQVGGESLKFEVASIKASKPGGSGSTLLTDRAGGFTTENATYGLFVEEQLGWREKLFLTGGARVDKNSAFGRDVGNTVYPRASLSYVISEEDWWPKVPTLNRLRLRSAPGSRRFPAD